MNLKKTLFLIEGISAVLLFSSCNERHDSKVKTYRIDNIMFSDWENLYNIENITELVKDDHTPLCEAYKCLVDYKRVVYWDYKAQQIYLFDREGNFINNIGSRGKSASEYVDVKSVVFNNDKSVVKVLDERGIINYRAFDGSFINREYLDLRKETEYEKFYPIENGYLFFGSHRNNSIISFQDDKERGLREREGYIMSSEHFYNYKDTVRVISDYGEFYIDSYWGDKLHQRYSFDLVGRELPQQYKPATFKEFMEVDSNPSYFKFINMAYETENTIFLNIIGYRRDSYSCFINKHSGKVNAGPFDRESGLCIMDCDGEFFYALVYTDYLQETSYLHVILKNKNTENTSKVFLLKIRINEDI